MMKHGSDNFKMIRLCQGSDAYINELEYKTIKQYNSLVPSGYNIRAGGEGSSICFWEYGNDQLLGEFTDREISEKLGVSTATVQGRRTELGIDTRQQKQKNLNFELCRHLLGKVSDKYLSSKYNICLQTIIEFREKEGIPSCKETNNNKRKSECKELFSQFNGAEISEITGISPSSVNSYRVELGLSRQPPRPPSNKVCIKGYEGFLGKTSDKHLAALVGCSTKVIKRNRDSRGLPSFEENLKDQGTSVIGREDMLHQAENICGTSLFTRYITPKGLFLSIISEEIAFNEIGRGLIYSQLKDATNSLWYRVNA